MKIATEFSEEQYSIKNNLLLFFIGISVSFVFVLLFFFGLSIPKAVLLLAASVTLSMIYNFQLIYALFILLIFAPLDVFLHVSVLYSLVVTTSFLICFPDIRMKDFTNPLKKASIIYIISIIPSLYNSVDPLLSIGMMYNFLGMLLIMLITMVTIDTRKRMLTVIYIYLTGVLVNSIYVIYEGILTGKRIWGFSGIFYVDFVGLATLFSLILFIYSSNTKKIFFGVLTVISIVGLILTQTRNAWLSTIVSILLLFGYLSLNSNKYRVSSRSIGMVLSFVVIVALLSYAGASTFSTKLEDRLDEKTQTTILDEEPTSAGENSFVTRAFIWHTAIIAFLEHPVFGIGAYSFPFSSQIYHQLPKSFYEIFVRNRTPHVTYLAILTETGIIGFIGFTFFLVSILKIMLKNLSRISHKDEIVTKLLVNWAFVYILISMFMTDAWLWGQQAMIMGIILGLILSDDKLNQPKVLNEL